jgi:hypothetical protein
MAHSHHFCIHLGGGHDLDCVMAAIADLKGALMSELDDHLAEVTAQFDTFRTDLDRELADFGAKIAGALTPDQQAAFDALSARFTSAQAAVDAADPAPAGTTEAVSADEAQA